MSSLNVDIAAQSEVCFPGEGSLQEHGTGYILFWSRKPTTEGHLRGVGFLDQHLHHLQAWNLPTGHSDCMMSIRLPLKNKRYATLFSVYAPTLWDELAEKGTRSYAAVSKAPLQTRWWSWLISFLKWAKKQITEKVYLADRALVTVTIIGTCCRSFALSSSLSSPTPSFSKRKDLKQSEYILHQNIGIPLTAPLRTNVTSRKSFTRKWCPALNAIPTIA